MRIRILLLFFLVSNSIFKLSAQEVEGALNLHSFADNREYGKSGRYPQTIFGIRFSPELGLLLDSTHRIRVGFNAIHEFGSSKFTDRIEPVVYYQYMKKNWDFYMGAFPRHNLLSDYPRALLNDTLNYYRPNVEGMLVKFENENWKQTVWIDWTSRQTATARENFLFGISGKYKKGVFFLSHYAMMLHNAGPAVDIEGDHIEDNGALIIKPGIDLSDKTFLDSLTLNAGGMMSFERVRTVGDWNTPKGLLLELHASYHNFGITNSYYKGEGHNIRFGDRFYTSKVYNRTDLTWRPIVYKNIEGIFALSFHFVDGVVDNQQSFGLRYNISGKRPIKR
ncbi:MAG: hypothetical protein EOO92_07380 [Pedobacter sp.]|nr:MAG: hypothetical protein EOO92_07380 [Pedobacter sp.]